MATGIKLEISDANFREVLNSFKNEVSKRTALIDAEIAAHGELMSTSAKQLAPFDTSRLRGSISLKKEGFLQYQLVAQTDYAAYQEFGTGKYAASYVPSLDEEWQKIAKQFQKSKDPSLQGVPPTGFMNRSVKAYTPSLIKAINKVLKSK
jgi:hypothetical protein